mmetsp:Transcript_12085/g.30562  ORF Transcript_12085/g.30562 Transcript_12085/m.30562 type:complete len:206 (-) Transcript_12085:22-639(-)
MVTGPQHDGEEPKQRHGRRYPHGRAHPDGLQPNQTRAVHPCSGREQRRRGDVPPGGGAGADCSEGGGGARVPRPLEARGGDAHRPAGVQLPRHHPGPGRTGARHLHLLVLWLHEALLQPGEHQARGDRPHVAGVGHVPMQAASLLPPPELGKRGSTSAVPHKTDLWIILHSAASPGHYARRRLTDTCASELLDCQPQMNAWRWII